MTNDPRLIQMLEQLLTTYDRIEKRLNDPVPFETLVTLLKTKPNALKQVTDMRIDLLKYYEESTELLKRIVDPSYL